MIIYIMIIMLIQLYYYNYIILLLNFSIITFLWKHDFDRTQCKMIKPLINTDKINLVQFSIYWHFFIF